MNHTNQSLNGKAKPDPRRALGQRGEAFVAAHLVREGGTILARNWRHPELGELDIITRQGDEIVFVEVRARRGPLHTAVEQAIASVGPRKRDRLAQLAQAYLALHDLEGQPWRVDVAAVGIERGTLALEIIHHAVDW